MSRRDYLILSATEQDRPGLVAELTGFIADRGCNVEDSRVAVLGGYAGLLFLISGEPAQVASVAAGLEALERGTGIRALARHTPPRPEIAGAPSRAPTFVIVASALDHQGIIYALTDVVRGHGANILELETSTESAPMSGDRLFALRMMLTLPESTSAIERLRVALQTMALRQAIDLEMYPTEEQGTPALRLI